MTTELIFFVCFIAFIVGILLLDMLVIDKEAHEVSMKEAGIWTAVWITGLGKQESPGLVV